MVLTTVPQTALPVLAAEGDVQDEIQIDLPAEFEEETPADSVEPVAGEEGGETEEEETPAPAESEITEEESEEEEPAEDADVTEEADGEAEEETPAEPVVEEEPSEEPVSDEGQNELNSLPNAAVVSAEAKVKEAITNKDADDKTTDNAWIHYPGGCTSGEGESRCVVENSDLVFKVELKDGRALDKVAYKIGEDGTETDVTATAKTGSVTIEKSKIFTTAEKVTTGKPITISVVTRPVVYTVALDNSADSTNSSKYDLYAVTGEGDGKLAATPYDGAKRPTVKYGETLRFALVPKTAEAITAESVEVNGISIQFVKAELEQEAAAPEGKAEPEKKTAYVFTVDPAKYELKKNEDDTATVNVAARALNQLTVTMTAATKDDYQFAASTTNTDATTYINYKADGGFAKINEESEDLGKALAFVVKATDGNVITAVTATAKTADASGDGAEVTVVSADIEKSNDKECTIALNQPALDLTEGALTLTVSVKTDLDEVADGVTKITFAGKETGDLAHMTYKGAGTEAGLESATAGKNNILVKGTADNKYFIQVTPEEGYEFAKGDKDTLDAEGTKTLDGKQIVTIKETRKVTDVTDPVTATYAAAVYTDETADTLEEAVIELALAGTTADSKAYTVTKVEVTAAPTASKTEDEKLVTFSGDLLDSVTIENASGVVLIEEHEEEKTYAIAEGTDLFAFSVAAEKEPAVVLDKKELTGTAAADGKSFKYSIAATTLSDTAVENAITVNAAIADTKTVTVKVVKDNLSDDTEYKIDKEVAALKASGSGNKNEYVLSGTTSGSGPAIGSNVSMKLAAEAGVIFGDVTYTVKGEEAKAATVSADKTTAAMEFTVTEDVEVIVETESLYRVVLSGSDVEAVEGQKNAYTANYDAGAITAELVSGVNNKETIYDAVVLDNGAAAATKATVGGTTATISKIEKDDIGRTLTVRLYKSSKESYEATLLVSGESTGVTVKMGGKEVSDDGFAMPADSKVKLEVSATGTEANTSDLKAAIVIEKEGGTSAEKVEDFFTTAGELTIDGNNEIAIQAKPAKAAPADNVFLVVSSKHVKDETDNTKDKVFKKLPITLTGPLVKSADIKGVKADAAPANNRAVRMNLALDLADAKKLLQAPLTGNLFYKVEFTDIKGDAEIDKAVAAKKLELKTAAELLDFVAITKNNGSYAAADFAKFVEYDLVKSFVDDQGNPSNGDLPGIITVTAKVTLVQSLGAGNLTSASVADTDYVAGAEKDVTEGLATRAPIYETKLAMKTVNGAKVFTGQQNVTVATPNFSKDTTCDDITVQFVDTKTGKLYGSVGNKKGNAEYKNTNNNVIFSAGVNTDNSVWVSSAYASTYAKSYKDLGVKVTAHAEDDEYCASAVVKLKVQQGIYSIETDESKAALPTTLFRDSKGKVKSVKIATKLNGADKDNKPAKAALTWEITDSIGRTVNEDGCDLDPNIKKALTAVGKNGKPQPAITVKNGTVNVTTAYQYNAKNEAANTFYVKAKAADYAGNSTSINNGSPVKFVISTEPQVIDKLAVVNDMSVPVGVVSSDKNGTVVTLKAEELIENNLQVVALKQGAEVDEYGCYMEEDVLPATITISGKLVTLDKENHDASKPGLVFSKPGDKIAVTAKTVDGNNAKPVKMTLNVKPFEKLGLKLSATNGKTYGADPEPISYSGSSNERFALDVMYYSEFWEDWRLLSAYKNVKVTVKNGKFVANKDWAKDPDNSEVGRAVVVASGKKEATVELTDTGAKNKKYPLYTITADVDTSKMKAPNIKMTDPKKLTAGYRDDIKWKVSDQDSKTKEYIYAGQYVKLAPDYTVAPLWETNVKKYHAGECDAYALFSNGKEDGLYFRVDENGEFTTAFGKLNPGAYKLVATVGEIKGGEFVPTSKDKKLSFSVPKAKTTKESLSVTGNYKLDVKSAAEAKLLVKSVPGSYTVSEAKNVIKKDQKLGDHSNLFTDYFEVKRYVRDETEQKWVVSYDEDRWVSESKDEYVTIGLKPNLTVDQINDITGKNEATKKEMKDNCTGYITVNNGSFRKDIKITISFSELKKYTAKAAPLFENKSAITHTVEIYNGKAWVPVKYAAIDTGEKAKNDIEPAKLDVTTDADGNVALKSTEGFAAGKYTISLKVVPESVALIKENTEAADVLGKDKMLESYAVPAELKLEVKELAKADKTFKADMNVKLATYKYDSEKNSGYELGAAGKYGSYRADIPYTLTADNISVKAVNVTLEGNDTSKVVTAEMGTAKVWNKVSEAYDSVPAITLKLSKEAFEKDYDAAKKKSTYYGKKLTVPVEITYGNSANDPAKETVKFNITIPKRPADAIDETTLNNLNSKLAKLYVNMNDTPAEVLERLESKIYGAVAQLVPADTDFEIRDYKAAKETPATPETPAEPEKPADKTNETTDPTTPGTGSDTSTGGDAGSGTDPVPDEPTTPPAGDTALDIVKTGKAEISFKVVNNVDATKKNEFKFTYDLGIKPNTLDSDTMLLSSLKSAVESASITYADDKTANDVLDDLKKVELVKKVFDEATSGRQNYTVKVKEVKQIAATKKSPATMSVKVEIRNLIASELINGKYVRTLVVTKNVEKTGGSVLSNFDTAYKTTNTFFKVAQKIKEIFDANNGQPDDFWKAVEAKAKETVNNPDITVTVENKVCNLPETVDSKNENGTISFTLKLTETETGRVRNVKSAEVTIPFAEKDLYAPIADVVAAIDEIFTTKGSTTKNDKLKTIANPSGADAVNDGDDLKAKIETEIAKIVEAKPAADEPETFEDAATQKKGYTYEIKDWDFSPATQKNDASVSFKVEIASTGSGKTGNSEVSCTDLITKDEKYQTVEELADLIENELAEPIVVDTVPTDINGALNAVKTEVVTALCGEGAKLTVKAEKTTDEKAPNDVTKNSQFVSADAEKGTPASITLVKITVDVGATGAADDEDAPKTAKVVVKEKITFAQKAATP